MWRNTLVGKTNALTLKVINRTQKEVNNFFLSSTMFFGAVSPLVSQKEKQNQKEM